MKVTVQLLDSVADQLARGDKEVIDPDGVSSDRDTSVFWDGDYRFPVGTVTNFQVVDGALWADVEIPLHAMAIGGVVREQDGNTTKRMDLLEVSIVRRPAYPRAVVTKVEESNAD